MLRILIADDHPMIRQGLRQLLEGHKDWEVCAEASTGRQAVELALKLSPDVVVLDLAMPELSGLEAIRQVKKALPCAEVLIFTVHNSQGLALDALAAGAWGYLLKSNDSREVVAAVEALSEHEPYFTSEVSETLLDAYIKPRHRDEKTALHALTGREREIFQLVAEGRNNEAVSAILGVTVKTVESHRTAIHKKLGVHSMAELVRYAVRHGVIEA
jgi:DNA-binding NarL/FixJ family response regulator